MFDGYYALSCDLLIVLWCLLMELRHLVKNFVVTYLVIGETMAFLEAFP